MIKIVIKIKIVIMIMMMIMIMIMIMMKVSSNPSFFTQLLLFHLVVYSGSPSSCHCGNVIFTYFEIYCCCCCYYYYCICCCHGIAILSFLFFFSILLGFWLLSHWPNWEDHPWHDHHPSPYTSSITCQGMGDYNHLHKETEGISRLSLKKKKKALFSIGTFTMT